MIKALIVDQADDDSVSASIREIEAAQLPDDGEVDIAVEYSTINYKDGLCLNGLGRLVRTYPHVPGIDLAGTVISSRADGIAPGDRVTMNGFRSGEIRWGGYATQANGKAEWIVKLPDGMSTRHSQMLGTAGFTAMQSILRLEANGMTPDGGEVLVTGAGGGVGSVATVLLAKRGYQVAAMTGRAEIADYLTGLGASRIVSREDMLDDPGKPMESGVWGGCIDCVGGQILARAIKQMNYGCGIASLGNTAGVKMEASIIPFLLRGVAVLGIDSVMVPVAEREKIWAALDAGMPRDVLESMSEEIGLADVPEYGKKILEGKVRGRILVNVNQ
ncbi:MAG: acryloyl-CoA reductase [Pseudomonadota bacterium]|nr:acryloyl-CoA reductase [Pseudomonadota bacterium]